MHDVILENNCCHISVKCTSNMTLSQHSQLLQVAKCTEPTFYQITHKSMADLIYLENKSLAAWDKFDRNLTDKAEIANVIKVHCLPCSWHNSCQSNLPPTNNDLAQLSKHLNTTKCLSGVTWWKKNCAQFNSVTIYHIILRINASRKEKSNNL